MKDTNQNMKRKLYIHIGAHKTGTSAIQRTMWLNRSYLAKNNLLYPGDYDNHYQLAYLLRTFGVDELIRRNDTEDGFHKIMSEVANSTHDVLLSSEGFSEAPEFAGQLLESLNAYQLRFDVTIILYVRRQDEWFESAYRQQAKGDTLSDFNTFFNNREALKFKACNYYDTAELWAQSFGHENIIVRPYERAQLLNNDLISDFCSTISIPVGQLNTDAIPLQASNKSLSDEAILFFVFVSKLLGKSRIGLHSDLYGRKELYTGKKTNFQTPAQKERLYQYLGDSNSKLAKEYLGRENGDLFLDTKPLEIRAKQPSISKARAFELLDIVLQSLPENHYLQRNKGLLRLGIWCEYKLPEILQKPFFYTTRLIQEPGKKTRRSIRKMLKKIRKKDVPKDL